uniref:Uncharacterized protein n=1 Tax=Arundo donax TaxID=35708 RepID=A0A0A9D3D0_ARUDO
MIAALASGKLQPTPEVLEKLRLYEEEGLRRDHEKLVWMRARDEASARSEAAGGRGLRERTMAYDYECDREAFQDYARISRQRARHEASASAVAAGGWGVHERTMPYGREAFQDYAKISRLQGQKDAIPGAAAGRSGLGETGGLDHEATDKLVNQAKIQVDSVGLAKPVLGLGTELPDQLRFRMKQLPSVHTGGQLTPKVPEKMMHCEKGAHQDYAKVDQLQQAWQEAGAGTTAGGGCQHERMVLYEQEFLQDFAEFTRLQKASFGAAPGGGLDGVGGRLNHEVMDKLVRRAMERMQGMVEILTPQVFFQRICS